MTKMKSLPKAMLGTVAHVLSRYLILGMQYNSIRSQELPWQICAQSFRWLSFWVLFDIDIWPYHCLNERELFNPWENSWNPMQQMPTFWFWGHLSSLMRNSHLSLFLRHSSILWHTSSDSSVSCASGVITRPYSSTRAASSIAYKIPSKDQPSTFTLPEVTTLWVMDIIHSSYCLVKCIFLK